MYEATITVPSTICAGDKPRHKSPLEFEQINDLQIKLSKQANKLHVVAVPHGTNVEISGQDEEKNVVLVARSLPKLTLKGVSRQIPLR